MLHDVFSADRPRSGSRAAAPCTRAVALAAVLAVGGCASTTPAPVAGPPRSASASDYFPLDAGWKWAYELDRAGQHMLAVYSVLERVPDGAIVQAGDQRISYAVTPAGIAMKDGPIVGDFVIKNPVALGASWNVASGTAKIVSVDKAVSGPSGDYKNCVVVEVLRQEPTRLSRTTFAPGVGPVDVEVMVESEGRFVTTTHATLRGATKPGQDPLAFGP